MDHPASPRFFSALQIQTVTRSIKQDRPIALSLINLMHMNCHQSCCSGGGRAAGNICLRLTERVIAAGRCGRLDAWADTFPANLLKAEEMLVRSNCLQGAVRGDPWIAHQCVGNGHWIPACIGSPGSWTTGFDLKYGCLASGSPVSVCTGFSRYLFRIYNEYKNCCCCPLPRLGLLLTHVAVPLFFG